MRLLIAVAIAVAVPGCSGGSGSRSDPTASEEAALKGAEGCRVTQPEKSVSRGAETFNYGNDVLRVALWPNGTLVAGPLPDGSSYATIRPDGSIEAKLGWWRAVDGRLSIGGERLDADAPTLRAEIPDGYGARGFQPTELIFPTAGCWRVIGKLANSRLPFVVRVVAQ